MLQLKIAWDGSNLDLQLPARRPHVSGIKTRESHSLSLKLVPTWLPFYCLRLNSQGICFKSRIALFIHRILDFSVQRVDKYIIFGTAKEQ